MPDDVVLNKVAAFERALRRVGEEYGGHDANLFGNPTRQDAILLNLQRVCESAIDLAMRLVRVGRLGVPQDTRDAFTLLAGAGHAGRLTEVEVVDPSARLTSRSGGGEKRGAASGRQIAHGEAGQHLLLEQAPGVLRVEPQPGKQSSIPAGPAWSERWEVCAPASRE